MTCNSAVCYILLNCSMLCMYREWSEFMHVWHKYMYRTLSQVILLMKLQDVSDCSIWCITEHQWSGLLYTHTNSYKVTSIKLSGGNENMQLTAKWQCQQQNHRYTRVSSKTPNTIQQSLVLRCSNIQLNMLVIPWPLNHYYCKTGHVDCKFLSLRPSTSWLCAVCSLWLVLKFTGYWHIIWLLWHNVSDHPILTIYVYSIVCDIQFLHEMLCLNYHFLFRDSSFYNTVR